MAAITFKTMSSSTPAYLNDLIQTAVPVRPLRSSDAPLLNVPRTMSSLAGLFRSRLRTLGTHYHPTLDPAVLWTSSNDTSIPICWDSLNLTPPAPLYLRTVWRYTNAAIIVIIVLFTRKCRNCAALQFEVTNHALVRPRDRPTNKHTKISSLDRVRMLCSAVKPDYATVSKQTGKRWNNQCRPTQCAREPIAIEQQTDQ